MGKLMDKWEDLFVMHWSKLHLHTLFCPWFSTLILKMRCRMSKVFLKVNENASDRKISFYANGQKGQNPVMF